jgi:ligand-binding sensor domain-containing protein/signal transduction histidine kinase
MLPSLGQDSLALTTPDQRVFSEVTYQDPITYELAQLPSKNIASDKLTIIEPEVVQLKNLTRVTYESPSYQSISFIEAPLSWNNSIPIDFNQYSDRSKLNLSKFDSDQGLVTDMIQDMAQDPLGNWWLATADSGLIQYDGTRQRIFNTDNGLSSNLIQVLLTDHLGQLWIGTDEGIDIFDGQQLKRLNTTNGLPDNNIWSLHEDDKNQIWIGTEKGLVKINPALDQLKIFTTAHGLPENIIWTIYQGTDGQIWVGTEAGVAIFEEISDDQHELTQVKQINGLPTGNIWSINEDSKGQVWMGSNGRGIYQWSNDRNEIRVYNSQIGLSSDWIWDIFPIEDGMWFGTYSNGAVYYEEIDGKPQFRQLRTDEGLTNNYVLKITADEKGNLWMGTDGGGVNVLQRPQGVEKHYTEGTGLSEKFVQCIFRDSEGLLWMGTDGRGVNIIDEFQEKVTYLSEGEGLSYNSVWAITEDAKGQMWIGTESGLNVYDKSSNTITIFDTLSGLSGNAPWTLFRDKQDHIWIGTGDRGLTKFDATDERFIQYTEQGLGTVPIMGFTQDDQGNVWVGSHGLGLFRILPTGKVENYTQENGLSGDHITYLFLDSKKRIWAGTEGHGVNYFNSTTEKPEFKQFTTGDGLSHPDVWSIIEDDNERIWIGTVNKITILNFDNGTPAITGYVSTEHGLKSNDLNPASVWKESDGTLIWATIKGPSAINPNLVQPKLSKQSILLTGLEIEGQYIDFRSKPSVKIKGKAIDLATENMQLAAFSNMPKSMTLPHQVADINFNFTAQKTYFRKDLQFQYRLNPVDESWRQTQTQSSVILNNLGPGDYTLELRVKSVGGSWSDPTSFPFTIATPWWETWVARISGLLILILILYAFYVIRTRSLIKSKEFLENKVTERTYELERSLREVVEARNQLVHSERMASLGMLSSGIAHELSNPISAVYNASQLIERDFEDILNEQGDQEEARKNIKMSMEVLKVASNQTREIIRGLTNYSRLESKEMILGDVHQCLDNSIMLIQSKLGDIKIEKNYHPDVPLIRCYYTELTQVFLNLISNAIDAIHDKGDSEGIIKINTSIEKRFVKIAVSDSGIGMSYETSQSIFKSFFTSKEPGRGTGLGLAISQSIIKKHHGSISFETEKGVGTTFITLFPVDTEDY